MIFALKFLLRLGNLRTPQQVSLVLKKQDWNTVQRKWIDFDQTSLQSTWIGSFQGPGLKDELGLELKKVLGVQCPQEIFWPAARKEWSLGAWGWGFKGIRKFFPNNFRPSLGLPKKRLTGKNSLPSNGAGAKKFPKGF